MSGHVHGRIRTPINHSPLHPSTVRTSQCKHSLGKENDPLPRHLLYVDNPIQRETPNSRFFANLFIHMDLAETSSMEKHASGARGIRMKLMKTTMLLMSCQI